MIVIPAHDLADLLGYPSPAALPELPIGLQATTSLDDALDLLETQTMIRALQLSEPKRYEEWKPIYLLVVMTSRCDPDRLQVVLKLGEGYGVAGLLLGYWWPGVTVSVQEDGTVIPSSPGLSALMRDVPIGLDVAATIRRLDVLVRHRQPSAPPADRHPPVEACPDLRPPREPIRQRRGTVLSGRQPPDLRRRLG